MKTNDQYVTQLKALASAINEVEKAHHELLHNYYILLKEAEEQGITHQLLNKEIHQSIIDDGIKKAISK